MKHTLEAGIEHEFRFSVSGSKTVPALYPESPEFQQMPQVFATGFLVGLLEWAVLSDRTKSRRQDEVEATALRAALNSGTAQK